MKLVFLVCSLAFTAIAYSQEFGGNPPSVKWKQVNNKAAKVIFPEGLDSVGKQVAGAVERLDNAGFYSLGNKKGRVSIVLQNQSTISNAYVALGPFRSEFYLTPEQNSFSLGSLPWAYQLAIHEFRHIQQNINFNVGLSRAFRILFGQQGQALANSLVIPDWFYEGDAVFNETNVSMQGRGRLPYFYNGVRALWAENKKYSYMKLRNGSLKDFTPDHYTLGYVLVAYGNEKYGPSLWRDVTHDAASFRGLFYPFQKSVKKHTGKSFAAFTADAVAHFKSQFNEEGKILERSKDFIGDYEFPTYAGGDSIIFMKTTYNRLPAFTLKTASGERRIRVRDVSLDKQFSYQNKKIVYTSFRPATRWGWRNFSELKLIDLQSGTERRITRRTKYFSPDISEDGSTIVTVNFSEKGKSALHFVDAGNGMVIKEVPNPENYFHTYPKFYTANEIVSAVRNTQGQMSLALTDAAAGNTRLLLPFSYHVIAFPAIHGDTVYFSASGQANDRLFAFSLGERQLYEISSAGNPSSIGKYQPTVTRDKITWSGFTAEGFQLTEVNKKDLEWKRVDALTWSDTSNLLKAASFKNTDFLTSLPDLPYEVKKYKKTSGLLNFHSLIPLVNDPEYSLTLLSENILNTLQSELSFMYNRNERFKQVAFNGSYGAWFPYINGGINFNIDRREAINSTQVLNYNELEFRLGPQIPLNLSRGKHLTSLHIGSDYVFNRPYVTGYFKDSFNVRNFQYLNNYVIFSNQVQKARQHIYPRFAQSLTFNVKRAIVNSERTQFSTSGYFYLPGLFVNHNLVLNAAYQKHDSLRQGTFPNQLPFSRGYNAANFYRMGKLGLNYHVPLLYPDFGIANIVYFLRVRSNLFYDYTRVKDFDRNRNELFFDFRSAGTEVFFDTKWWNMLPVSFGVRYSYLFDTDIYGSSMPHRFELVLPVNLIPN